MDKAQRQAAMKNLVVLMGESATDVPWPLSDSLTPDDVAELRRITRDPSHPWMIEYKKGLPSSANGHPTPHERAPRSARGVIKSSFAFLLTAAVLVLLAELVF